MSSVTLEKKTMRADIPGGVESKIRGHLTEKEFLIALQLNTGDVGSKVFRY